MTLGYSTGNMGLKGQGHRVSECILHTNSRSITQKTNDPEVFKHGVGNHGNDLVITYSVQAERFWVERSKVKD